MAKTNPRTRRPLLQARPYDAMGLSFFRPFLERSCDALAEIHAGKPRPVIWVVGPGGSEIEAIRRRFPDSAIHLVDPSSRHLRRLDPNGRMTTIRGNILRLHPRMKPDAIFIHNVAESFDHEQQRLLAQDLCRALKRGGSLHYLVNPPSEQRREEKGRFTDTWPFDESVQVSPRIRNHSRFQDKYGLEFVVARKA